MSSSSALLASLRSPDEAANVAALNLLPLPPERASETRECFALAFEYASNLPPACVSALLQALQREFAQRTLPEADRRWLLDCVMAAVFVRRDVRYIRLLRASAAHMGSPALVRAQLDRALRALRQPPGAAPVGAQAVGELLRGGAALDAEQLRVLLSHPDALSLVAKPLLRQIERHFPREEADQAIVSLLRVVKMNSKLMDAVIAMANPPAFLVDTVRQALQTDSIQPLIATILIKRWPRPRELNIVSVADLARSVISSPCAVPEKSAGLLALLKDVLKETNLGPEEMVDFFNVYAKPEYSISFQFVAVGIENSIVVRDAAIQFMQHPHAFSQLREWCAIFPTVVGFATHESQKTLFKLLHHLTINEISYGHVTTATGLKFIQTQPFIPRRLRTNSSTVVEKTGLPVPAMGRRLASFSQLPSCATEVPILLRGWREISLLLAIAPTTPETLGLMIAALRVHGHALTSTFARILAAYDRQAAMAFIGQLLGDTQQHRVMGLEILARLSATRPEFAAAFVRAIVAAVVSETGDLVRCRALRALQSVDGTPMADEFSGELEVARRATAMLARESEQDSWSGQAMGARLSAEAPSVPPKGGMLAGYLGPVLWTPAGRPPVRAPRKLGRMLARRMG
jgi:hypothetical protein